MPETPSGGSLGRLAGQTVACRAAIDYRRSGLTGGHTRTLESMLEQHSLEQPGDGEENRSLADAMVHIWHAFG
jgi:hypothetical protein